MNSDSHVCTQATVIIFTPTGPITFAAVWKRRRTNTLHICSPIPPTLTAIINQRHPDPRDVHILLGKFIDTRVAGDNHDCTGTWIFDDV